VNPTRRSLLKAPKFLAAFPFLNSAGALAVDRAGAAGLLAAKPGTLDAEFTRIFNEMWLADSHEHLVFESERPRDFDFFDLLSHYTLDDLTSSGLPPANRKLALNKEISDEKRWAALEPWWQYSRFTGYAMNLRIAIQGIYGFDEISSKTIGGINAAIREKNKPGLYREVLKNKARIQFYVLDDRHPHPVKPDPAFYVLVREFDDFIVPQSRADVQKLERLTNTSITSLATLEAALRVRFQEALDAEMCGVKCWLAYTRSLYFGEVTRGDAEAAFARMMLVETRPPSDFHRMLDRPFRSLEDHMFHQVVGLVNAHHLPLQIHTGLNNRSYIENANPVNLTNLFFLYPGTKFVLFHLGYPFLREVGNIGQVVHQCLCRFQLGAYYLTDGDHADPSGIPRHGSLEQDLWVWR
jgi:hypothetical protein